jgi:hypothetical protein
MAWFTIYNILSPRPADELVGDLDELIASLDWTKGEARTGEDGSQLIRLERGAPPIRLGLWIVPLEEGAFRPPPFDEACDEQQARAMRSVCKVGGQESPTPAEMVRQALALSAEIARLGRIYDMHAELAYEPTQARELARRPFDIREFITYHYLAPPSGDTAHSWLHLHGMAKFYAPDIEAFDLHPEVSHKGLNLLLRIAGQLATTRRPGPGEVHPFGHGAYRLRWSAEVRPAVAHFSMTDFDEVHQGSYLTVEDAGNLSSLDQLLRGAYEMEPKTQAECAAEQQVWQEQLEALRRAWRQRGEDQVILRAALKVGRTAAVEHIWIAIESWKGDQLTGKLLNDAYRDPTMVRGSPVELREGQISGVSLFRGELALDEVETLRVLEPAAAALLDAALKPARSGLRAEENTSPDGAYKARFIDDGRVAYLQVNETTEKATVVGPIWLYNRLLTPPVLDLRPREEGLLPLMSQVFTNQRTPNEAPQAKQIRFRWEGGTLLLVLDGVIWARVDLEQRLGWSRLITLPNQYGRPWKEEPAGETSQPPSPEDL